MRVSLDTLLLPYLFVDSAATAQVAALHTDLHALADVLAKVIAIKVALIRGLLARGQLSSSPLHFELLPLADARQVQILLFVLFFLLLLD